MGKPGPQGSNPLFPISFVSELCSHMVCSLPKCVWISTILQDSISLGWLIQAVLCEVAFQRVECGSEFIWPAECCHRSCWGMVWGSCGDQCMASTIFVSLQCSQDPGGMVVTGVGLFFLDFLQRVTLVVFRQWMGCSNSGVLALGLCTCAAMVSAGISLCFCSSSLDYTVNLTRHPESVSQEVWHLGDASGAL